MKDPGQTTIGVGTVPNGPDYDRSAKNGQGDEVLRQTAGSTQVTTGYPAVAADNTVDQGRPGPENGGFGDRGYTSLGDVPAPGQVHDATVSADGRRRVKHINEGD